MLRRKKPWRRHQKKKKDVRPTPSARVPWSAARRGVFVCTHLAALAGVDAVVEPGRDVPAHLTQEHHASGLCESSARGHHHCCQVNVQGDGRKDRMATYWWTCRWSHKVFWPPSGDCSWQTRPTLFGPREHCLLRETGRPSSGKEFLPFVPLSASGPQSLERRHPQGTKAASGRRATGSGIHLTGCQDLGWHCQTSRRTR